MVVVGVRRSVGVSQMLAAKGVPATSSTARDQFIRGRAARGFVSVASESCALGVSATTCPNTAR